jgi:hypothetical protein
MLGCSPCRLHQPLDIGFTGIQRSAMDEVPETQRTCAAFQH